MIEGANGARRKTRRRVTVLGSTGSVGCNTVELLAADPDAYEVEALAAHRNAALLAEQARKLGAKLAVVADDTQYRALKAALAGSGIDCAAGPAAVVEAATRPAEWVMAAIVGAAGLASTMAAVERGAMVAFANKEVMVCAGTLITDGGAARRRAAAAGRQRAQRHLSGLRRFDQRRGDRAHHADRQRRPVPEAQPRRDGRRHARAGGGPSQLAHGRQDLGR